MLDFDMFSFELKDIIGNMIRMEFPDASKTGKGYNIKCPLCGNSKSHYKKGKGHFFLNKAPYMYYCFNSGECIAENGIPAFKFLQIEYPDYYKEYIDKIISASKEDEKAKKKRQELAKKNMWNDVKRNVPIKKNKEGKLDVSDINAFVNKNKNELINMKSIKDYPEAMKFCADRNIPETIYKRWLYVPNNNDKKCFTKNRIIIPFKNSKKEMYFYQARSIVGAEPKYKNAVTNLRPIFNYYEADFDKEVMIVEGPIDSLFLENAVATLGTKYDERLINAIKKRYFIFDNDKAGIAEAKKHLENGEYVFMWKKYLLDNNIELNGEKYDFNDLAIKFNKVKFTFEELSQYFTNNILMDGLL
jgi:hypothetical protein